MCSRDRCVSLSARSADGVAERPPCAPLTDGFATGVPLALHARALLGTEEGQRMGGGLATVYLLRIPSSQSIWGMGIKRNDRRRACGDSCGRMDSARRSSLPRHRSGARADNRGGLPALLFPLVLAALGSSGAERGLEATDQVSLLLLGQPLLPAPQRPTLSESDRGRAAARPDPGAARSQLLRLRLPADVEGAPSRRRAGRPRPGAATDARRWDRRCQATRQAVAHDEA